MSDGFPQRLGDSDAPVGFVAENDEVFYSTAAIVLCDQAQIAFLKRKSLENARRRARLCMHPSASDGLHEMLIVHHRDAYVRPHWHLEKSESLHVIEGQAFANLFDENGRLEQAIRIGPPDSGFPFYYRIPEGVRHSLTIESEWFVFHEVTAGPFQRSQTRFPDWAPSGDDPAEVSAFQASLRRALPDHAKN